MTLTFVRKQPQTSLLTGESGTLNFCSWELLDKLNPPVQSVGVGITPLMAAPSLPLGPLHKESASTSTRESSAAKTHAPSFTTVRPVMESTPPTAMKTPLAKLEAMVIKNQQTTSFLQSQKAQTPVNVPLLRDLLKHYPYQNFVSYLCAGLTNGFRVGYKGPCISRYALNLPSANHQPQIIEANLLDEVQFGCIAGPVQSPPPPPLLGLVPKKNSEKWHTIFHLSYPKGSSESLNTCIPIEDLTLQYIHTYRCPH